MKRKDTNGGSLTNTNLTTICPFPLSEGVIISRDLCPTGQKARPGCQLCVKIMRNRCTILLGEGEEGDINVVVSRYY